MKLEQLPIGARFELDGVQYTKTGPLTAKAEGGSSRLIPRSAVIKPLDVVMVSNEAKGSVDRKLVVNAFEEFFRSCSRLVDETGRQELGAARERFLKQVR